MSEDDRLDKDSYEQMDKLFGGMFSEQFGSFEDLIGGITKQRKECKHVPDLIKSPVSCNKCGIRMTLDK